MPTDTQPSWGAVLLNSLKPNIEKSKTRINCLGLYVLAGYDAYTSEQYVVPAALALLAGALWNLHEKMSAK